MPDFTWELALRIVHVALAATWFGASWLAAGDIKHTVAKGQPFVEALPERIARLERLAIPSGLLAFVTGLGLVVVIYGFGNVPLRLWIVIGLTLATFLVGGLLASPAWRRVKAAIAESDLTAAALHANTFARFMRVEHTLRLATLVFVLGREGAPH